MAVCTFLVLPLLLLSYNLNVCVWLRKMSSASADDQVGNQTWPSFDLMTDEDMNEENVDVASLLSSFVDDKKLEEFQKEVTETDWYNKEDLSEEKEDFLPLDDVLMKESENGGRDASAGVSSWARKRFDSWRKTCRYDVNIPIEDIPLKDLSEMLVRFMLMVKKKNGDLYPAGSLSVLYRAIGRMVRKRQEKRICESGQQEVKFNIIQNEIFTRSTYAFVLAARRSRVKGVGVKTAKAPSITFTLEKDLLSDLDHQITHGRGMFTFVGNVNNCSRLLVT